MVTHIQSDFADALLDPGQPLPRGLTSHTAAIPARRFAVYRNNVVTSLVQALRTRFPAVDRLVGAEFFAGMARVFVSEHPPRSPLLMTYGDDFPDFIEGFAPAAELPYLADVARLEAARTRAYHAADEIPVDLARLQSLSPAALPGLRVTLHPSANIVRSTHPIVTIWAMNSGEVALAPIADWHAEDALVLRPEMDVEVRKLPPGGAAFIGALARDAPLAAAAEAGIAENSEFDLAANLAGLIGSGLVTAIHLAEPDQEHTP